MSSSNTTMSPLRALAQHPTVAQAVEPRRGAGQQVDGPFERQELVLADSLLQEAGGVAEGGDHVEVGPGIGRPDHGPRVVPDLQARLPVGSRGGRGAARERGPQPVGDGDVDERVERLLAELLGDVAHPAAGVRRRLGSEGLDDDVVLPLGQVAHALGAGGLLAHARSPLRVAQGLQLLLRRCVHDRCPALEHVEHEAGVEREARLHVDRHRQTDHLAAAGCGPVADLELGEARVQVGGRRLDHVPVEWAPRRWPTS